MVYGNFKDLTIEQLLIEHCVINHLILQKVRNMMDIKGVLFQWSIYFLIKNTIHVQINLLLVEQLKIKLCLIKNNYANQLLENSRKEKYKHLYR